MFFFVKNKNCYKLFF